MLRAKASSQLSKAHVLTLCAEWGYSHSTWRRKGDGARKRRCAAAHDAGGAARPALPPPPCAPERRVHSALLLCFDAASVAQFATWQLGAARGASCCALEGRAARAEVEARRAPHCCHNALAHYGQLAAACGAAATRMLALRAPQRAWAATAVARAPHAAAVWLTLPLLGGAAPADAALAFLRAGFGLAAREHADMMAGLGAATAETMPVLALAAAEQADGVADGLRFAAAADAALAAARAAATVPEYVALCDVVLDECACFVDGVRAAFEARAAWSRCVLAPGYCSAPAYSLPAAEAQTAAFCAAVTSFANAIDARGAPPAPALMAAGA